MRTYLGAGELMAMKPPRDNIFFKDTAAVQGTRLVFCKAPDTCHHIHVGSHIICYSGKTLSYHIKHASVNARIFFRVCVECS